MRPQKGLMVLVGIFSILALMIPAMAEDISGTWIAPTPNFKVTMVFTVNGTTLTGTVMTHPSDKTEIKDGKIKGDKISFYIERLEHQKKYKIRFKGTIIGEEINFTREEKGIQRDMIVKRDPSDPGKGRSNSTKSI